MWELVHHHIAHNHPNLALVDKEIAVIFRGKASKTGGQVLLGKSRKAGSIFKLLGKNDYKFILEIAGDEWKNLTNEQKTALIDHLLCACKVEEDEKTGDVKCSIATPEVSFFLEELKRHGDWRTRVQENEANPVDVEGALDLMTEKSA